MGRRRTRGQKTDVNDAALLRQPHSYGLLRGRFRPEAEIASLQADMRQRERLVEHAHIQQMQKALMEMNLQLHAGGPGHHRGHRHADHPRHARHRRVVPVLAVLHPDLNPMDLALSKLRMIIQKAAARTCDKLWQAVGHACNLFTDEECYNVFKAAGYSTDQTRHAVGALRP